MIVHVCKYMDVHVITIQFLNLSIINFIVTEKDNVS